jgi:hypothetical protein
MKSRRLHSGILSCFSLSIAAFSLAQSTGNSAAQQLSKKQTAVLLENLTWDEAERVLTPDAVVVIPLGAECKEHGRHLPLTTTSLWPNTSSNAYSPPLQKK